MTVYFWTPDFPHPQGGIRATYRFVDQLNGVGVDAAVLHQRPGFRASWFNHATRIRAAQETRVQGNDVLVMSELDAPSLHASSPGLTKVIFNQAHYWTFGSGPIDYRHPDIASVLTVSDDGSRYLRHAYPGVTPHRIRLAVDSELFRPRPPREQTMLYAETKGGNPRSQVLAMIASRRTLTGWDIRPLGGLTHEGVAEALGKAAIVLGFSEAEGFQLFLAEALTSGCAVVGYQAGGGREFLTEDVAWPVPAGEIVAFVQQLEAVAALWVTDRKGLEAKTRAGREMIIQRHTLQHEQADLVQAMQSALERAAMRPAWPDHDVARVAPRTAEARRRARAAARAVVRGR